MNSEFDYKALVNHEGQYCLWPETKSVPAGWKQVGPIGNKPDVLAWIKEQWTDTALAGYNSR